MVKHHWHFVPRPIIVEARYSRKFCRVVEYPHIRRQLCFEVHYITFTVIQLSTSCGTGTGALCRDRKRRSGRFLMKVSGTYFPVSLYDLGFMPERDHKFAVKVAGVTQQYNIERAHHEDGEIILELGALGER